MSYFMEETKQTFWPTQYNTKKQYFEITFEL